MFRHGIIACSVLLALALSPSLHAASTPIQHVLLISIDGFHSVDMTTFIAAHPTSTLAALAAKGTNYTMATCSSPSDSFPGLANLICGGSPKTTGIWYDDTWDRSLSALSGSGLVVNAGGGAGCEVNFSEFIDYDSSRIDAGASLHSGVAINPFKLPRTSTGAIVYPHNFVRSNTIFEVAKAGGYRTAWSDKHPAYEWVNGPSGTGVDDLYTPEIHASKKADGVTPMYAAAGNGEKTKENGEAFDDLRVTAILNEIQGKTSGGTAGVPIPGLFGMNFQAVSVDQKIDGYMTGTTTPTANLDSVMVHTDASIGQMVAALNTAGIVNSTLIIVTAKHGQSPINPALFKNENSTPAIADPNASATSVDATAFTVQDTGAYVWAQTGHQDATNITNIVAALNGAANNGISSIIQTSAATAAWGNPATDSRVPDLIIAANNGVDYDTAVKIAEHGGIGPDDTSVALLISNPQMTAATVTTPVSTASVAPTMMTSLGLDPNALTAVVIETTVVLHPAGLPAAGTPPGGGGATPPAASSHKGCGSGSSAVAVMLLGLAWALHAVRISRKRH